MKVKNFRRLETKGGHEFAEIDVKTWLRPWATRQVFKSEHASFWRWLDSGEHCDGYSVENLSQADEARRQLAE